MPLCVTAKSSNTLQPAAAFTSLLRTCIYLQAKSLNLNENLAVTIGGGFFGGILIGFALKKIVKIVAIIAGFFLAALAYLRYQQIANINWDRIASNLREYTHNTCKCNTANSWI